MARRNHLKRPSSSHPWTAPCQNKHVAPGCHLQLFFCVNALLFALALVDAARLPRAVTSQDLLPLPGRPEKSGNSLKCVSKGGSLDGVSYKWFKDDTEIPSQNYVLNLEEKSFGTFYCVVSNAHGTARSEDLYISPPQNNHCIEKNPNKERIDLKTGSDIILHCDHMECPQKADIKWFRERSRDEIEYDNDHIKTANGSLLLYDVTDNVKFKCKTYNYTDDFWKGGNSYDIRIGGATEWHAPDCRENEEFRIQRNSSLTLECLCQESVTWQQYGARENEISGHTLTLNRIGAGSRVTEIAYECRAAKSGGYIKKVTLNIEDPPRPALFEGMPDQLDVGYQGSASFDCSIEGTNTSHITWLYNNHVITPGHPEIPGVGTTTFDQHSLTLGGFDREHPASGVVQCYVRNNYGSALLSARFTVSSDEVSQTRPPHHPTTTKRPTTRYHQNPTWARHTDNTHPFGENQQTSTPTPEVHIYGPTGNLNGGANVPSATMETDDAVTIPIKYIIIGSVSAIALLLFMLIAFLFCRQRRLGKELKKYTADPNNSAFNPQIAVIQSEAAYPQSRASGAGSRPPEELIEEAMHLLNLAQKQQNAGGDKSTSNPAQSETSEVLGRRHIMERFINCQDSAYQSHSAPQSVISVTRGDLTHSNSDNALRRTVPVAAKYSPDFPYRHSNSAAHLQTTQL